MKTITIRPNSQPWTWLCRIFLCALLSGCGGGDDQSAGTDPSNSGSSPPSTGLVGPVTLTWEAPNQHVDDTCLTDLSGYRIYQGSSPGNYAIAETVLVNAVVCSSSGTMNACGPVQTCSYTLYSIPSGTWYFALQAFDASNEASGFSNVVSKTVR